MSFILYPLTVMSQTIYAQPNLSVISIEGFPVHSQLPCFNCFCNSIPHITSEQLDNWEVESKATHFIARYIGTTEKYLGLILVLSITQRTFTVLKEVK